MYSTADCFAIGHGQNKNPHGYSTATDFPPESIFSRVKTHIVLDASIQRKIDRGRTWSAYYVKGIAYQGNGVISNQGQR